jgi:mRNA-degrading endonuclease RelE of RelBE toxin-antitoxin system
VSYKIALSDNFKKEAKRLIKKYPSLKVEINDLGEKLSENPAMGTSLGNSCYKIRLSIASKGKGKSTGARIITCVFVSEEIVFLLSIYDKSAKSNISDKELDNLLKFIR